VSAAATKTSGRLLERQMIRQNLGEVGDSGVMEGGGAEHQRTGVEAPVVNDRSDQERQPELAGEERVLQLLRR
jgi:hypothetical protein